MKNIYYITNMFPSKTDNYGIFCKKVYDFFQSSDIFCVKKISAIYGKSNNKIYNIFRYAFLLLNIMFNLLFCIRKIDLIYIQYVWKHAFFVSFFSKCIKNKKVVINFHGEDLTNYENLLNIEKKCFKNICDIANLIIVPSNYFKKLLLSVENLSEHKIFVSPSGGIDSEKFYKNKILVDEKVLIYCSRFDQDKGWDDFIYCIRNLINDNIKIKAKMIGYGKETLDVLKLIKENRLENFIELYENISQLEISKFYSLGYVFVFPTRRLAESLGLVALEAMSCGLPVVASNIGAISDYVIPNVNGFLYTAGDVNALSVLLKKMLEIDNLSYEHLSDNARKMALKYKDEYVKKDFVDKMKSIFMGEYNE